MNNKTCGNCAAYDDVSHAPTGKIICDYSGNEIKPEDCCDDWEPNDEQLQEMQSDEISKLKQERDTALSQVASLTKECDRQRSCCVILWQEVKGKCEECSVFFGGGCQNDGTCNLRKVLDLTYEAAESVNALVGALKRIEQSGTGTLDGVVVLTQEAKLARQALAEWRENQ